MLYTVFKTADGTISFSPARSVYGLENHPVGSIVNGYEILANVTQDEAEKMVSPEESMSFEELMAFAMGDQQ